MAQFRIGDKVRVVGVERQFYAGARAVGHEGVIIDSVCDHRDPLYVWLVRVPGVAVVLGARDPETYFFRSCDLAPLTDPSADQFLARLRKLATEPVNDAPKVTVREGIR